MASEDECAKAMRNGTRVHQLIDAYLHRRVRQIRQLWYEWQIDASAKNRKWHHKQLHMVNLILQSLDYNYFATEVELVVKVGDSGVEKHYILDFIARNPDGHWVIIDWKTGCDDYNEEYEQKMCIYAQVARAVFGSMESLTCYVAHLTTGKMYTIETDELGEPYKRLQAVSTPITVDWTAKRLMEIGDTPKD